MSTARRILIVEDERDAATTLGEFLSRQGYAVEIAANGSEAIACVERAEFDLVLTDLRMPGLDGMAFVAALRELLPDTPFVVMTGHGNFSEPEPAAMVSGIEAVLWKPLSLREISLKLRDILD